MKTNKIFKKFLLAGGVVLALGLTSCEDFLTVLPTDQITEDDFWKDKNDLDNVRSAAYLQMTKSDITGRILYWGELRSDNFTQNDMSQSHITYLQQAILQPTQGMFKWSNFYTGINYCNKVLEKGEALSYGRTFVLEQKVVMLSVQCDKHNLFFSQSSVMLITHYERLEFSKCRLLLSLCTSIHLGTSAISPWYLWGKQS